MAKKKATGKKQKGLPPKTNKKSDPNLTANLMKAAAGLLLLLFLVILAGFLARKYFPVSKLRDSSPSASSVSTPAKSETRQPTYEVFSKHDQAVLPERTGRKRPTGSLPRVAIIIDDFGYDSVIARKFCDLGVEITFSILPFSPQRNKIARMAKKNNHEVILHLPLEPMEYPKVNPGPGVLLASMTPDVLLEQLKKDLDSVPYIKGVNNHMGSKLTTISTKMYQVFSILKKRELFFVDSRTSKDSLCKPSARLLKIPFGERDVFLDHSVDPGFIRKQFRSLYRIAVQQGEAIGIGHPHLSTYQVLREEIPTIQEKVQFVKASSIVQIIGE